MQVYFQTMKTKTSLFFITLVVLVLTVGFWYGLPLFGLTDYFFETEVPGFFQYISICLSVGFCFSLFFIPFHLSFAKEFAIKKQKNMIKTLLKTQGILIVFVAILFAIFYLIVSFILI